MAIRKSSRKVSLTKQLLEANNTIAGLKGELESLTKARASAEQSTKYAQDRQREADKELNAIGTFLDAVPNPPASKGPDGYTAIGTMTRLMVWLANRNQVLA
jgi:hypothetical protein